MPGKKKPFIDKHNAIRFSVVSRSQRDPGLAAGASEYVLKADESNSALSRVEEQQKWGINFSDDYDYMQHLRDMGESGPETVLQRDETQRKRMKIPASVLPSLREMETGLLNMAAPNPGPHPEYDPDIVAALDGVMDEGDELDDDFVQMAGGEEGSDDDDEDNDMEDGGSDVASDGVICPDEYLDSLLESGTRMTQYSATSAATRTSYGLQLIDGHFEKFWEQYADETELGGLEGIDEGIEGFIEPDSERMLQLVQEFQAKKDKRHLSPVRDAHQLAEGSCSSSDDERDMVPVAKDKREETWDCETILTTYSNLYNHPKLIEEDKRPKMIKLGRNGLPVDGLGLKALKQLDSSSDSEDGTVRTRASTVRRKDETAEERRERKKMVKQERRERRVERKANQLAFKLEKERQTLENMNLKNSVAGGVRL